MVQWIEHGPSKPVMGVRFLPGAQCKHNILDGCYDYILFLGCKRAPPLIVPPEAGAIPSGNSFDSSQGHPKTRTSSVQGRHGGYGVAATLLFVEEPSPVRIRLATH